MPVSMFPEEQAQFDSDLFNSQPFNAAPGFFTGSLMAIPKGIATGLGKGGELAGTIAAQTVGTVIRAEQAVAPWSRELGQLDPEQFQHNVDSNADAYLKATRADPQTVGTAGQILHTFADVGTRSLAAPEAAVGAVAVGTTEFAPAQREFESQGIDKDTAQRLAAAQAVLAGAGALLPGGVGAKASVRVASGATINFGVGAASRYNTHQVLEDAGYPEQAAQYRVLDGQAMAADVLLGSFFGWMHHPNEPFATPKVPQDVADAGLELLKARQAEIDLAPGIPATQAARDEHIQTLNATEDALIKGDPLPPAPDIFFHGTAESTKQRILSMGRFQLTPETRTYDYSEFGSQALYFTGRKDTWLNPEWSANARAEPYETSVGARLAPDTNIVHVNSDADLDAIARRVGLPGGKDLMDHLFVDMLKDTGPDAEFRAKRSAGFTKKLQKEGIDGIYVTDKYAGDLVSGGEQLALFSHEKVKPVDPTVPNPAQDAAREAATAEQANAAAKASDGLVSATKRANEPPKTTEQWVREQIARERDAARAAKAAEAEKAGEPKPAENPIDPETQHAIDAIDSTLASDPSLHDFEFKDPDTGEVVKASDALEQLREQALGDKDTATLHEIAAACGGRA